MGVQVRCNGYCGICQAPCFRGEIKGNQEKTSSIFSVSPEEEQGASEAFDKPVTDLAVIDAGQYEVVRKFGKERIRKVR